MHGLFSLNLATFEFLRELLLPIRALSSKNVVMAAATLVALRHLYLFVEKITCINPLIFGSAKGRNKRGMCAFETARKSESTLPVHSPFLSIYIYLSEKWVDFARSFSFSSSIYIYCAYIVSRLQQSTHSWVASSCFLISSQDLGREVRRIWTTVWPLRFEGSCSCRSLCKPSVWLPRRSWWFRRVCSNSCLSCFVWR